MVDKNCGFNYFKFMELLKPAQFAKQIGVSRAAISKAIKNELIPTITENGKKLINPVDPIVKEYAENIKAVREDKQKDIKIPKPVKVAKPKKEKITKPVKENGKIPVYLKKISDSGQLTIEMVLSRENDGLTKTEMDKIRIYEDIKQKRQKRLQERRELINIKFIRLIFGKIYDIHVNEFQAIKTRVKPDLAKIFKTNDDVILLAAEKAIDEELWETLRRIKSEFDDFLKKVEK